MESHLGKKGASGLLLPCCMWSDPEGAAWAEMTCIDIWSHPETKTEIVDWRIIKKKTAETQTGAEEDTEEAIIKAKYWIFTERQSCAGCRSILSDKERTQCQTDKAGWAEGEIIAEKILGMPSNKITWTYLFLARRDIGSVFLAGRVREPTKCLEVFNRSTDESLRRFATRGEIWVSISHRRPSSNRSSKFLLVNRWQRKQRWVCQQTKALLKNPQQLLSIGNKSQWWI